MAKEKPVPKQYKTAQFKALQKEWDKILKEDGFVDIEKREYEYGPLKGHWIEDRKKMTRAQNNGGDEYYRMAGRFFWKHTFRGKYRFLDKVVWKLHCEGLVPSKIVLWLKENRAKKDWPKSLSSVKLSINRTKKKMLAEESKRVEEAFQDAQKD